MLPEEVMAQLHAIKEEYEAAQEGRMVRWEESLAALNTKIGDLQAALVDRTEVERSKIRVKDGKYEGMDLVGLRICQSIQRAVEATKGEGFASAWGASIQEAIDSTTAGWSNVLDEEVDSQIWREVLLELRIGGLFRDVAMPTNPFKLPTGLSKMNWYAGVQNTSPAQTDIAPGGATLTAHELAGEVAWSYDVDEDSSIAVATEVRDQIVRDAAEVIDDVLLNADTDRTATNINNRGTATPATDATYGKYGLGFEGLRNIVQNNGQIRDVQARDSGTLAPFNQCRNLLGEKGINPTDLAYIVSPTTFFDAMNIEQVVTVDKFGADAVIRTGQLASLYGIPILVSPVMRANKSDGEVDDTPGNNDRHTVMLVNTREFVRGYRRRLLLRTFDDTSKRSYVLTASMRIAFIQRVAGGDFRGVSACVNVG